MFDFQSHAIFPTYAVGSPGALPREAETLTIDLDDGQRLHGVHISPTIAGKERLLILGFGGNAWNAQDAGIYLHQIYPEADVITFHYRGYRPSTGQPSATALIADAPLVFDFAVKRVKPDRTIAVGFSIGSGIAATLAERRSVDGLILVTPFDSLKAAAADLYPFLPVGMMFQHEIDTARALERCSVPTAIIAAANDNLILPARTDAFRKAVPNLIFDRTIAGADHNDIYGRSRFHEAMRQALAELRTAAPNRSRR